MAAARVVAVVQPPPPLSVQFADSDKEESPLVGEFQTEPPSTLYSKVFKVTLSISVSLAFQVMVIRPAPSVAWLIWAAGITLSAVYPPTGGVPTTKVRGPSDRPSVVETLPTASLLKPAVTSMVSAPPAAPYPAVASTAVALAPVRTMLRVVSLVTVRLVISASAKVMSAVAPLSPLMSQTNFVQST